jgi:imidazolonepropionase-like amidohydrolase
MILLWIISAVLVFGITPVTAEEGRTKAFVGARIIPVAGEEIEDGVLIVRAGRIDALGRQGEVAVPDDAEVIDRTGTVIFPGLVDTHSHIGDVDLGERSAPIQPELRVLDSVNVRDASLQRARAGGITTANIMSGSGMLMSGQTIYLKLRAGETIDDLLIRAEDGWIAGGMKMANGTNSRAKPPFPGSRAKSSALVRATFIKAQEYRDKLAAAADDPEKKPDRDIGMEALVEVLEGRRIVHHHTHRHDDVLTVLRLRDEFGFRVVLHHVSDASKVAERIAAAGVPSSLILVDSPGGKLEARDLDWRGGPALEKAGGRVAFHTDDFINDSRLFLRSAAYGVRAGMSRQAGLESVTLAAAEMLDLDSRIGSLEPGKDADFIVLSGDPLSVYTRVLQTWVEGKKVFDLDEEGDRLIADGGYGAGSPRQLHLDCFLPGEAR